MTGPARLGFNHKSRVAAVALIVACVVGEAALLSVGIDDLDEGYFAQQAVRVLHGQLPYRDFATWYTPGLVYVHATLFAAAGEPSLIALRGVALMARAALALMLYVIARQLVRQPLWAAAPAIFLLFGLDDAPVRWEPHPGWLSTLFAVMAAWCLSHGRSLRWLIASGLAAAGAYLFKQNTGALMLAAILVWSGPRFALVPLVAFGAVTVAWLVPLLLALGGQTQELAVLLGGVNQAGLVSPPELTIAVPALCLLGGAWLTRHTSDLRVRWYLLASVALFATQYPRMDSLHLVWSTPLLLVLGAAALDRLPTVAAGLGLVGTLCLTSPTIASRFEYVQQPAGPVAGFQVPVATAKELRGVVASINERALTAEPIFVYPGSPLLYVLAGRPNPTRFDHLNPGALDARQIDAVIADLSSSQVRLVVISDFWQAAWGPPGANSVLEAWLSGRYIEVAHHGSYRVLMSGL